MIGLSVESTLSNMFFCLSVYLRLSASKKAFTKKPILFVTIISGLKLQGRNRGSSSLGIRCGNVATVKTALWLDLTKMIQAHNSEAVKLGIVATAQRVLSFGSWLQLRGS